MKRTLLYITVLFGIHNVHYTSEPRRQGITGQAAVQKYYERAKESKPTTLKEKAKRTVKGASYGAVTGTVVLAGLIGRAVNEGSTLPNLSKPEGQEILAAFVALPAVSGAVIGALTTIVRDAFRSTSHAWVAQLEKLFKNSDDIAEKVMYVGIPATDRGDTKYVLKNGKIYLLAKDFSDIDNAFSGNHYELYFMPKDAVLIDVCLQLHKIFEKAEFKDNVAFLAVRPTPGITKLSGKWSHKNLPRIIVGFKDNLDKDKVKDLITKIHAELLKAEDLSSQGLNVQPRYSQKINNLMYVAYGSGDYKDTEAGKKAYEPQKKSLYYKLFGSTDEQMAYSNKNQEYYPIK